MKDFDEYELWIDAYSPETIPMERLAMYLAALAKLLGHEKSVHLERIDPGSTTPVARVEREAVPKVFARIDELRQAANDADGGSPEINGLLRSDNAIGRLFRRAAGSDEKAAILFFPGRESKTPEKFGPFNESGSVDGELLRVGGTDSTDHALVRDPEGRTWSAIVSREMAQRMGSYIHQEVRLNGEMRWERSSEGEWKLLSFRASDFLALDDQTLVQSVAKLRALRDSDWSSETDIDGAIDASRGHNDGLH